ncbi:MAG TPA: BadF/BadG/BcrA/BcrD ATPase family protein [Ureibacillus sp.]|nr:BadF/BadG/BcrA/BcrD ATPase family protein [Ureibacillus sp.]
MKKPIILAVDGGATKTTVTIRSTDGECLFEKTGAASNYQIIGVHTVIERLSHLLHDAFYSTKLSTIDVAVFAIAGIDTASDLDTVTQIVQQAIQNTSFNIGKLIIENDVHATLLGLAGPHPGALLISGTGSIAFATNGDGKIVRSGGWGHRASDDGSGYWIGQQILKAIFRAEDELEQPTLLKELVFTKLGIGTIEQLMVWLYQETYTNAETASISSVLPEAFSKGDEKAIRISHSAATELFLLVKSTLTKIDYEGEKFPLYLNGSILKHHPSILSHLQHFIHQSYPHIIFKLCDENPIEAIVNRAKFVIH